MFTWVYFADAETRRTVMGWWLEGDGGREQKHLSNVNRKKM